MKKLLILVCVSLLIGTVNVFAVEQFLVKSHSDTCETDLLLQKSPGLRVIEGEIINIGPEAVTLRYQDKLSCYKLAPDAKLFYNGHPGLWQALLPVTKDAFFEARAILNATNQVVLISGYYDGAECVVKGWQCTRQLQLVLAPVEEEFADRLFPVSEKAKIPPGLAWLQPGQVVFVLYNFKGEIRAVYLPD